VLTTGSALAVDWAKAHVPAILVAWYPGQRGGTAVADVLFGEVSPGGRLPVTFYKESEKLPPFDDYSMRGRTYRYFEGEPLYPFGYGLSYTRFEYSKLKIEGASGIAPGGSVSVSFDVTNVGKRAGEEVVQLYVASPASQTLLPRKELRGFQRIAVKPGETRRVSFALTRGRDLAHYDESMKSYVVRPGEYEIQLGASSADIRLRSKFRASGSPVADP